ncbi:MAG: acyl carrier protein [Clostridia bacterium]|nr:acyl carrier protein [Clostridia bacterium]MBR7082620.1 acyl carrier protein [Clostridia bacterium]
MLDTIKKMLAEEFNLDEDSILADSKLEADLGINSLELAELAFRLEEEFGIEIKDEDIPTLITVGDVANYIEEKK